VAITASIALNPTTVQPGVIRSVATVTVSNGAAGGPAVPILGVRPIAYDTGTTNPAQSVTLSDPLVNGKAVAAAGSATVQFEVAPHQPQVAGVAGGPAGPANLAYDITCEIVVGDGTVVIPTAATLTVNPPPRTT
jgi:hypothetical protein